MSDSTQCSRRVVPSILVAIVMIGSLGCGGVRGAALGAAVGGIAGGKAGKGAGAGAMIRGVAGRSHALAREEQVRAESQNDWARAFAACMSSRSYSVG